MLLPKILVPVDSAPACLAAAKHAAGLARRFSSEIELLHVFQPPFYDFGAAEAGAASGNERAADSASRWIQSFLKDEFGDLQVKRVVLDAAGAGIVVMGDVGRRIVEYAHSEKVSLIVMPTRGRGLFRQFLLGSVTAKVLHDSECPVWTGVHLEEPPHLLSMKLPHIVCALDLGPQSSKILEWASQLAASFDARLTIVHATPSLVGLAWAYCVPVSSAELSRSAHEEIERLQANRERKSEVCVENGEVAGVICGATERLRPDLLVIGRGAASKPLGRLRTHSYSIIRQAPCPVVSV